MISQSMQDALNKQVNEELFSAYLYASMVNYFESINLKGFAQWMRFQTQEELLHAQKFVNYVTERGGRVKLAGIAEPQNDWDSPLAAFEGAYAHERHISECINKLKSMAMKESDHATSAFLEWFVNEQVEEEANADGMVQQLRLVANAPGGLFMIDQKAALRPAPALAPAAE